MADEIDADELATRLRLSLGPLVRKVRQIKDVGDVSLPEASALAHLERTGPATGADLARAEQITPQAMATTLRRLESAGLIERAADPGDGRRIVLSLTDAGRAIVRSRRTAGAAAMAARLRSDFTAAERAQLLAATELLDRLGRVLP